MIDGVPDLKTFRTQVKSRLDFNAKYTVIASSDDRRPSTGVGRGVR